MAELFGDLRAYDKSKNWMWFELFICQPIGLYNCLAFTINSFLMKNYVMRTWVMLIISIVWVGLTVMTLARKGYSYRCWIALLILQTITSLMNARLSFWSITIPEIMLVLLVLYYNGRKAFFYKEVSDAETGVNCRKGEIELIMLIHFILAFCLHCSLGRVSEIKSMTVYENEMLAMLGGLYGGGLYLAFRWEDIT
ncbi:MAG: hypothetical protein HFI44_16110 [Lachnospiraceae bacterium]|nr:hypothetical protein [Lachnospiraceae bacterium]GFI05012.1 hypothetical protein IMSAGC005_03866 [Lachnospiraceae bacterium]